MGWNEIKYIIFYLLSCIACFGLGYLFAVLIITKWIMGELEDLEKKIKGIV